MKIKIAQINAIFGTVNFPHRVFLKAFGFIIHKVEVLKKCPPFEICRLNQSWSSIWKVDASSPE